VFSDRVVNPEPAMHETQAGDVAVVPGQTGLFESFAALGTIQRERFTRDDFPQVSATPAGHGDCIFLIATT